MTYVIAKTFTFSPLSDPLRLFLGHAADTSDPVRGGDLCPAGGHHPQPAHRGGEADGYIHPDQFPPYGVRL